MTDRETPVPIIIECILPEEDLWNRKDGMYWDRQGQEITLKEWYVLMADIEYRRVRRSSVHGVWISTVWLGLDHSFGDEDHQIFETMVLTNRRRFRHRSWADWQLRHASLAEAVRRHDAIVSMVRARGLGIFGGRHDEFHNCLGRHKSTPFARKQKRDRTTAWRPINKEGSLLTSCTGSNSSAGLPISG